MKRKSSETNPPSPVKAPRISTRASTARNEGEKQTERVAKSRTKKDAARNTTKNTSTAKKEQTGTEKTVTKRKTTTGKRNSVIKAKLPKQVSRKNGAKQVSTTKQGASARKEVATKGAKPAKKAITTRRTSTTKTDTGESSKKAKANICDEVNVKPDDVTIPKDIMFEKWNHSESPDLSYIGRAKSAIRAVLTNDMGPLKSLVDSPKDAPSLLMPRSVDNKEDALCVALEMDNRVAMELLFTEMRGDQAALRMALKKPILKKENHFRIPGIKYDDGEARSDSRGYPIEGDAAFMKDIGSYQVQPQWSTYVEYAANNINDVSALQPFFNHPFYGNQFKDDLLPHIWKFAHRGAYKITGELIKMALQEKGGHGFNQLHYEVLTCKTPKALTSVSAAQGKKKPNKSRKITPLHLAAINPNPKMVLSQLATHPDVSIKDKNGFSVVHYAAACESCAPLKALISKGITRSEPNCKGLTPLMVASKLGRVQNMRILLNSKEAGSTVANSVNKNLGSMTSLHLAAENGQWEACRLLVKHGANVGAVTSLVHGKVTPLMLACRHGHYLAGKTLVESGAKIEDKDQLDRTSLTLAVMNGNYAVASYLLEKGADHNSRDSSGNRPIHYAAAYGWWHCVRLLLQAGAEPNVLNDLQVSPLYVAFLKGHTDCVDILIKEAAIKVDSRDSDGWTLVMRVVSELVTDDTLLQLKFLIEKHGADVTLHDKNGRNAFHHLLSHPIEEQEEDSQFGLTVDCIKLLVKHGCRMSDKDKSLETPVNVFMRKKPLNMRMFLYLMKEHANIPLNSGWEGENILHLMAKDVVTEDKSGWFELIWKQDSANNGRRVMEWMAAEDRRHFTPFFRLAKVFLEQSRSESAGEEFYENVTTLMKLFVQRGKADVDYVITRDKTAYAHEKESGALFFFLYPLNSEDSTNIPRKLKVLQEFLELKPRVDIHNYLDHTPLLQTVELGPVGVEAARMLISAGADVNASSYITVGMESPVIAASRKSFFSLVELLLTSGACPSSPDAKNTNVMHHVAASKDSPSEAIKCLELCLSKDCHIDVRDWRKRTPLHYAAEAFTLEESKTDVVWYLLEHGADALAQDDDGRLPLHYAFHKPTKPEDNSHLDPIEVVLMLTTAMEKQGADTPDVHGCTPLHYAAYRGAASSTMHLIEHISDVNAADSIGNTALSFAAQGNHENVAIMLIQQGANIDISVSTISDQYKVWDQAQTSQKGKQRVWRWEKKRPAIPHKLTVVSLLYKMVKMGWRGLLHLLTDKVEEYGLPKTAILQAAVEAQDWELALSLVEKKGLKLRNEDYVNDKNQNMLHLLALNCPKAGPNEQETGHLKITTALLALNMKPSSLDVFGCSALTYAILTRDHQLCSLLIDHEKEDAVRCLCTNDTQERTAFSALFFSKTLDEDMVKLLCDHGLSLNGSFLMPDWTKVATDPPSSLLDLYHVWKPPMVYQTPLIAAVRSRNQETIKFLLESGADVNISVDDDSLVTPMMEAVRTNDIEIVKLLIDESLTQHTMPEAAGTYLENAAGVGPSGQQRTTCDINFQQFDGNGRNVFHYLLLGHEAGIYENTPILKLLAEHAPVGLLTSPDGRGQTPVELAVSFRADKLIGTMEELTNQHVVRLDRVPQQWSDGIDWRLTKNYDFEADAAATLESRPSPTREHNQKAKVDSLMGLTGEVELLQDVDKGIPYSVKLIQPQVENCRIKMTKYYIMQIVRQKDEDTWYLYTRWGTIGGFRPSGESKREPYTQVEDAIKEFCHIFSVKTSNQWADSYNRESHNLFWLVKVPESPTGKKPREAPDFDLASDIPSELPQSTQELLRQLVDVRMLHSALELVKVDPSRMPFGRLSKEMISEARDILKEIRTLSASMSPHDDIGYNNLTDGGFAKMTKIVEQSYNYYKLIPHSRFKFHDMKPLNDPKALKDAEKQLHELVKLDRIVDQSYNYYKLIPHLRFTFRDMKPLNDPKARKDAEKQLHELVELQLVNRMLLGAHHRIKEMNPLDYIYQALGCQIQLIEETSTEAQLILQQIEQTKPEKYPNVEVEAIYRLARDGEADRLYNLKLDNHQLLWHGIKASNLVSIMRQGLLIQAVDPPKHIRYHHCHGIYFSPVVAKAVKYCHDFFNSRNSKFMLLCEVAVGKSQTDARNYGFKEGFNSLSGEGKKHPDYNYDLRLASGVSISMGEMLPRHRDNPPLDFDDVIVYSENQVCLRYLVQFR